MTPTQPREAASPGGPLPRLRVAPGRGSAAAVHSKRWLGCPTWDGRFGMSLDSMPSLAQLFVAAGNTDALGCWAPRGAHSVGRCNPRLWKLSMRILPYHDPAVRPMKDIPRTPDGTVAPRPLLARVPEHWRAYLADIFLDVIRQHGEATTDSVVSYVSNMVHGYTRRACRTQDLAADQKWATQLGLRTAIAAEALDLLTWELHWQALPYIRDHVAALAPTAKQFADLSHLEYCGASSANRAASDLIDPFRGGTRNE